MMLTEIAVQSRIAQSSLLTQLGDYFKDYNTEDNVQLVEDVNIILSGKYEIVVNKDVIGKMERDGSVHVNWSFDDCKKTGNNKFNLKRDLMRVIHRRLVETKNNTEIVVGYTKSKL